MSQHIPENIPLPEAANSPQSISPPPKLRLAPVNQASSQDYWDFGHADFMPQPVALDHDFADLRRAEASRSRRQILGWSLFAVVITVMMYSGYEYVFNNHNLLDDLVALTDDPQTTPVQPEAPTNIAKKAPPTPKGPATKIVKADVLKVTTGNPYLLLPNKILGNGMVTGRDWTTDEERTYRLGLDHRFRYQHFKTVQNIRKDKLAGSASLLWIAIKDKGFWVRMTAAIALAEFAAEVPLKTLEAAIKNARSDLIANFFERFVRKANPGQLYLMRQMVRLLDEKGRLVVLRAIDRSKDELRDLYLVAATQDPAQKIQVWAKESVQKRGIEAHKQAALLAVVRGESSPNIGWPHDGVPKPAKGSNETGSIGSVMSADDLDEPLDQPEDDGSKVRSGDDQPDAALGTEGTNDLPAAATFENNR